MTNPPSSDHSDRIEASRKEQGQTMKLFVESIREYFAAVDRYADTLQRYENSLKQSVVDSSSDQL